MTCGLTPKTFATCWTLSTEDPTTQPERLGDAFSWAGLVTRELL